jgi:isochorismate synthase
MKNLLKKTQAHYRSELPFVVYAFPNSDSAIGLFQKNKNNYTSEDYSENGFVFAPFTEGDTLIIPENETERITVKLSEKIIEPHIISPAINPSEKTNYQSMVESAIHCIKQGRASKIVTSRVQELKLGKFDLSDIINRLLGLYITAFRYVWYHPRSGLWCGASPEVFLKTNGKEFSTMALAGTKKIEKNREPRWTTKEIDEQKYVADAIATKLHAAASIVRVSKIKNHRAGSLIHLRTDFTGVFKKGGNNLSELTKALHPSPAVCGTPQKAAKVFILENENYDREYYTGFLGPVSGLEDHSDLYVNLRCMKMSTKTAFLYVGGGITEASQPSEEWEETRDKLQTMIQVLAPML